MRVISGIAKGHKLITVDDKRTRPIPDRVKESIFNILQFQIFHTSVLDVFAGSGSFGIEFLSRGSKRAIFIDSFNESCAIIEKNLIHCKLNQNYLILNKD